jgi:hypothetical protein
VTDYIREPSRQRIKYIRKEPERPPTPIGERVFPKNITNADLGEQRPPKQVDDLMASLSGQKLVRTAFSPRHPLTLELICPDERVTLVLQPARKS